ncbi:MAG: J domain-containing protein [Cyanobacteria bacterium P01_D01_bin.105]
MQNFRDYYEILGISKEADGGEVKRAYRALARQYHPDLNPGDKAAEEKFKMLGEAYDVLSDADKRSQYEEYSKYWTQRNSGGKSGGKGWGKWSRGRSPAEAEYSAFEDFDNFVEQLLKRHQENDQASMWQTPFVAESAPEERQSTAREEPQAASTATRSRPPREERRRENARSARQAYRTQPPKRSRRDAEADLTVPLEKAYAGGRERIRLEDGRSLEVSMPPGMVTGQRIRLKGQGIDGGNLYLRIEVESHPYFTLKEGDVYCQLPVTPSEAVLGGTIAVPTLSGMVNMLIPPSVQPGQRLKLTGKGYPISPDLFGDQIVEIDVVMPTSLDDEEKALYQELRNIERFDPRANLPITSAS